ncbi:MAG: MBL fold metallo-hydrolase [Gemmatimonas sp.]|jgi:ribonuclease BN (tRNA processing enzyme)
MMKTIAPLTPDEAIRSKASSDAALSRRSLLAALAAAPVVAAETQPAAAAASPADAATAAQAALKNATGTKLVILGTTGGPVPMLPGRTRHMTSHVMLSNGAAYVLDCGLGVTNQYARTGIPFSAMRSIFLTHHHPDHNVEYGSLLIVGWVQGMPLKVRAFGPPPLKQMTEDFLRAYKQTVEFWSEDFHLAPLNSLEVQEVSSAGAVMQDDNVKVSATIVNHPPVTPALGYRFDFKDRSIAFSGDTTAVEAVAQIAKGADVLVHEALYLPALDAYLRDRIAKGFPVKYEAFMAHMKADHTPVEDVGRIAQEAGVKTLVLSHLTPGLDKIKDDEWREGAAKNFKGEIIVAHDLMVI